MLIMPEGLHSLTLVCQFDSCQTALSRQCPFGICFALHWLDNGKQTRRTVWCRDRSLSNIGFHLPDVVYFRRAIWAGKMNGAVSSDVRENDALIESLLEPSAYIHTVVGPVVLIETHISWVLLAGNFAYKIKKPMQTDFLDYKTLENRHHACCEELRLGNRYARGLYLDVVPITFEDGQTRMDGDARPIEFAVRMRRFDDNALLSQQLAKKLVKLEDVVQLAKTIAEFHAFAHKVNQPRGDEFVSRMALQANRNFDLLQSEPLLSQDSGLKNLENWTVAFVAKHKSCFLARTYDGFVRECHGDLHCDNIVFWSGHWVPFDGIEFNSELSWIDVANDISFLVMDLQERGYVELSAILLNAYLEETGDYQSLTIMRWYMVYRALVRAKVAVIRSRQLNHVQRLDSEQIAPAKAYIRLAEQIAHSADRRLWITHGVSGSGKTTVSQRIVQKESAIRIRSDVERKRLFKTSKTSRQDGNSTDGLYSPTASEATYRRLFEVAKDVLHADFAVVVDATFLRRSDRQRFQVMARSENATFRIVDFQVDEATLRERINHRGLKQNDASDATIAILASQLLVQEPLTEDELEVTIDGNESCLADKR